MSYYDVLGVPSDADEATIRSAFRRLARRYHPDAGEGSSIERFRQVVEAYETVMDPQRRRLYDLSLPHAQLREVPVEPMSIWAEPLRRSTLTRVENVVGCTRPAAWNDHIIDEVFRAVDDLIGSLLFRW